MILLVPTKRMMSNGILRFSKWFQRKCDISSVSSTCNINRYGAYPKKILEQLSKTPYRLEDISAVLITHDHSDHTAGLRFLKDIPMFAGEGTYDMDESGYLEPYNHYDIAGFRVFTLPTSHDAENPLGFVIEDDEEKLVYMTDTGYVSENNLKHMQNADYYIFESNHNVRMLLATNRPYELKQRILGDEGHLSNEDSAYYLTQCIGDKTKEIVLAHLSQEANTEEKALEAYLRVFRKEKINPDRFQIRAASQYEILIGGDKIKL